MTSRPGPPVRRPPVRRSRRIRRASAGLTPVRAGAILAMLLSAGAVYGVAQSTVFTYEATTVEGATFTDEAQVVVALEEARGSNLFGLVTPPFEERLGQLPTVRSADVSVRLPDTIGVSIRERTPILVWRVGARRYLADEEGQLFALLPEDPPPAAAALPVVEDRRAASVGLAVGRSIERVDIDAATRLASLVPSDLGSEAESLDVFVDDASGFTVRTKPASWQAVFGFYTPTLRTPDLIPGQVRLLRSLLIGREPQIERIILASETDGTYIPKPTPTPSATPAP